MEVNDNHQDSSSIEPVNLQNKYFICPNCISRVPLIKTISNENEILNIEVKCDCGDFKEPLIDYMKKMTSITISDLSQCISLSHGDKKADLYCYDCDRTLCTNCFTIHLDFFEEHFSFLYKPKINNKCVRHPEEEYSSFCCDCQQILCDKCNDEHRTHKCYNIEYYQSILKEKYINEYRQAEEQCNKYIEFIDKAHNEIINGDFESKEELKRKIINEYEICKERLSYQRHLIIYLFSNLYTNQSLITTLHNILVLQEILPLYYDLKDKTNYEEYLLFLQKASILDIGGKINYKELIKKCNHMGNNDERRKSYDIYRLFNKTGIYYGQAINYSREGKGIQYCDNKTITGEWRNDDIQEGTILKAHYIYLGKIQNEEENGEGESTDDNIGHYKGGFKDSLKNGNGTMKYNNETEYTGEWLNNQRSGKGTIFYRNSFYHSYVGEWREDQKNGKGTLVFENFDVYNGEFQNDMFNGQGEMIISSGGKYNGEWKNNKKNGIGTEEWVDGDKYEGHYENNIFSGHGKFTYADGHSYEGEWKDGVFNGKGTFTWTNGQQYIGDFINGQYNGQGTEKYADGSFYTGEWKDDHYNGKGTLTTKKGNIYEGDFKDGAFTGKGKLIYENGDVLEGSFLDGIPNGEGFMTYANGDTFKGTWNNGKREGIGLYTFKSSATYEGNWKDDYAEGSGVFKSHYYYNNQIKKVPLNTIFPTVYDGIGIFISTNGAIYDGNWTKGKRNGEGTMKWLSGEEYKGEWKDEKRNGYGEDKWEDGEIYIGQFSDNLFNGKGTYFYDNGQKYDGDWKNGMYNGKGTLTWLNGQKYEGDFVNNEYHGNGSLVYATGKTYVGYFINSKYSGKGTFTISKMNARTKKEEIIEQYEGEWKEGKKCGQGKMQYPNGDLYEGEWKNNKRNGKGSITYNSTGKKENGEWKDDEFQPCIIF